MLYVPLKRFKNLSAKGIYKQINVDINFMVEKDLPFSYEKEKIIDKLTRYTPGHRFKKSKYFIFEHC